MRGHVLASVAALLALSCRHGTDPATLDARTLRATIEDDALPMRATYFPPTGPRAHRRNDPLVVVEPLFFRRDLLYPEHGGGLVPYLEDAGFPVWLVWVDAPSPPEARPLGRGIAQTITSIATATGARRFDLLGLSMGSDAALRALDLLTSPGSPVTIGRVAFLGGGFDFAYPHSFASRIAPIRGGPASRLCALDGSRGCGRELRDADAATPWLGVLPPASDDALLPSRERFPFVAHFAKLPVLFVNGKRDGIAPSESMFPLYTLWGSDEPNPRAIPKLLFLAGRENALGWDFDHFDLLAGPHAERVWNHLVAWLEHES
jgi:hypothetical protein